MAQATLKPFWLKPFWLKQRSQNSHSQSLLQLFFLQVWIPDRRAVIRRLAFVGGRPSGGACEKGFAMPKHGKKDGRDSGQSVSQLLGASPAELEQLSSLLQLIRTGSPLVQSLLPASQSQTQFSAARQERAPEKELATTPEKLQQAQPIQQGAALKQKDTPVKAELGWQVAARKQKNQAKSKAEVAAEASEVVSPSNAEAVENTEKLTRDKPCFCLASKAEAVKALAELSSPLPMAVLAPTKIGDKGTEVSVLVKRGANVTSWTRFVIQLGKENVVFDHSRVARGGNVTGENVRVVVYGRQHKSPDGVWKSLQTTPKAVVDAWLKKTVGMQEVGRLHNPRLVAETGELSVVAEVPPSEVTQGEIASGKDGLFFRRFLETEEDRTKQRVVPLDTKHDRLASLRVAQSLPSVALGVVPTRKGWGIRVAADKYEQVLAEVNPEAQATLAGTDYLVTGLPLSWGQNNVKAFLGSWEARPVGQPTRVGFRNTWTVRATQEPPNKVLQNPDPLGLNVLATISVKEFKPRQMKTRTVLKQQRCQKKSDAKLPKSWAAVAAQRPAADGKKVTCEAAAAQSTQTARSDSRQEMAVPPQQSIQVPAFPPEFMNQLQAMIRSVVQTEMKPIFEELEQVKAVVDEDAAMQAKAVDESDSEDEEYDDDKALARLAATPASSVATAATVVAAASAGSEEGSRKTDRFNPY